MTKPHRPTAAVAGIWGPWDLFYSTNVRGTRYVIEGCREYEVRRLVFSSSPSVTFDGSPQRDAPALTLPLISPVSDATQLTLVIDEGDNSALPISTVQLLLPSYRLRFVRPSAKTARR